MGSTPNSSRWASMKSTISCVGGRAPPRRNLPPLQNLVGALEFSVLLLKLFDPLATPRSTPWSVPVIDVCLAHPRPHRLDAVAELAGYPLHRAVLGAQFPRNGRTIRTAAAFSSGCTDASSASQALFLRHNSILVSKVWSLHISRAIHSR